LETRPHPPRSIEHNLRIHIDKNKYFSFLFLEKGEFCSLYSSFFSPFFMPFPRSFTALTPFLMPLPTASPVFSAAFSTFFWFEVAREVQK
jgi:hypothetical protein